MTDPQRHALLLVGSPRTPANSESLGQYLLDRLTEVAISYLKAQIAAGVQAVQLFDTWIGALSRRDFLAIAGIARQSQCVACKLPTICSRYSA